MKLRPKGFTLVELLVVIGIIALLISILLPSLNKARMAAKEVACMSNLRQLGLSFHMYAMNNHGTLPEAFYYNNPGGWNEGWAHRLFPLLKSVKVFTCPTDPEEIWSSQLGDFLMGYGMNYSILGSGLPSPHASPGRVSMKLTQIKSSTELILAGDSARPPGGDPVYTSVIQWDYPLGSYLSMRHRGGMNVLLADGHVEWHDTGKYLWYFNNLDNRHRWMACNENH